MGCWVEPKEQETHDQTAPFRIDLHVSSQNTHGRGVEGSFEVSELLIGERLNRRSVDGSTSLAWYAFAWLGCQMSFTGLADEAHLHSIRGWRAGVQCCYVPQVVPPSSRVRLIASGGKTEAERSSDNVPGHVFGRERNRIFCHHRLSCRCMRSDKDRIAHFESVDSFLLERIQLEWVLEVSSRSWLHMPRGDRAVPEAEWCSD